MVRTANEGYMLERHVGDENRRRLAVSNKEPSFPYRPFTYLLSITYQDLRCRFIVSESCVLDSNSRKRFATLVLNSCHHVESVAFETVCHV